MLRNGITANANTVSITVICPNSTPTLKLNIDKKNLFPGKPISFNALAKPIPCINPNIKTISMRHGLSLVINKFSMAINKIDNAIMGSTTAPGATIKPFIDSASVMECATVNAVACHNMVLTFVLNKQRPVTNKIWSNPFGNMCI